MARSAPSSPEAQDRGAGAALLEQRLQLVPEPRRREIAHEPHLDAAAREPLGVCVETQPVPALVPDRAEDPRRIVDEREVVEHAQRPLLEVAAAAERIDEPAQVLRRQRDRHRVQGEVAPEEILADGRSLDRRQRRRGVVELRPGRDEVDVLGVAVRDRGGAELLVRPDAPSERLREPAAERDRVALDRDVDVEPRLAEQDVAHGAADEIHALRPLAERRDRLGDRREPLERAQLGDERGRLLRRELARPLERAQEVAAGDDADEGVAVEDRDAAVLRVEHELPQLGERRVLRAGDGAPAHDPLDRRVREPVADRLVEILAADRADEPAVLDDEHAALPVPLAERHRARDLIVGRAPTGPAST